MYSCIFFGKHSQKVMNDIKKICEEKLNIFFYDKKNYIINNDYPQLILVSGENNINIEGENIILIFTDNENYNINIKNCIAVICENENINAVKFACEKNYLIIDYGMSAKSTITFSSVGEENDIICLQRNITLNDNTVIEPMDIKLNKHTKNPFAELIFTAIKIASKIDK